MSAFRYVIARKLPLFVCIFVAFVFVFEGNNCNVGVPARHRQEIALQPNSSKAFLQDRGNLRTGHDRVVFFKWPLRWFVSNKCCPIAEAENIFIFGQLLWLYYEVIFDNLGNFILFFYLWLNCFDCVLFLLADLLREFEMFSEKWYKISNHIRYPIESNIVPVMNRLRRTT